MHPWILYDRVNQGCVSIAITKELMVNRNDINRIHFLEREREIDRQTDRVRAGVVERLAAKREDSYQTSCYTSSYKKTAEIKCNSGSMYR